MKALVVYYSHSGNTTYVAQKIYYALQQYAETDLVKLEYRSGGANPIMRLVYKLLPTLVDLAPTTSDLKEYDIVCLGIPVVAGTPSSAISKYIRICDNIDKRKIVCLYVYGLEMNARRCAKYIRDVLLKSGKPNIIDIYVPWFKARDENALNEVAQETLLKMGFSEAGPATQKKEPTQEQ
ncbi:MAG: flavodoxin family protein [Candidatus Omnitrophota bacterium]|nr:MAG: flavodoxin family protein [Candidatus Omnitrophota bacterium]